MILAILLATARMHAHLLIGDPASATSENRLYLADNPHSLQAHTQLVKSLASQGDETQMMHIYEQLSTLFPEEAQEQELLETLCWGVLKKGEKASGLSTQLVAILGSALTQDVYAVKILERGMHHSNSMLRCVSVQLAALFGDKPLKEQVRRLYYEEKVWEVRKHIFSAIGKLKMAEMVPDLLKAASSRHCSPEERREVIKAVALMREKIESEELEKLVSSSRASLRMLACECIAALELIEQKDFLYRLVSDNHPEVKAAALRAMGILRLRPAASVYKLAYAKEPNVGVTAGWLLLLSDQKAGEGALAYWLSHEKRYARSLAAAAISAAGSYGIPRARNMLDENHDPYVRANLALALISQRVDVQKAAEALDTFLRNQTDKLMWKEDLFTSLQKSTHTHNPLIPDYPEVVNQTVRLELLNLLAMVDYPEALDALKVFLKQRKWGVTAIAAEVLLGEGDENAVTLVRELLDDPNKEIRTEAALVLGMWGRDSQAISTLIQLYPEADRNMKIKILETLGRIGDREIVPFLVERLKEPSQTLRIIAASVLLQTLNQ
ncbi:MAG: hypothetical protein K940chlam2_01310 [Chlamydiae bacterium]|nr:hypothetical protein [Chlamydiota bacterium]